MKEKNYIIIPGASDLNRGDQALVWETKRVAEEAGFRGIYYMVSEKNEPTTQSEKLGLKIISPVLEHPSRKFRNKSNIKYNVTLKLKWGLVALEDLIWSTLLLNKKMYPYVKKILPSSRKKSLEYFENADAIFMKGGGLLQTYGGISSTYSMYFWVYSILLAHTLSKPVYIMPNSFGPFKGPFVKKIAKMALKKCKFIASRESISQKNLKQELGITSALLPDLAFCLPPRKLNKKDIFSKYNLPNNKKLVAITVRPYRFPKSSDPERAYENYKNQIRMFIKWLYTKNYMPVIVQHTLAINAHEDDMKCIRDIINGLDKKNYRIINDTSFDCRDLKEIYSYCDFIIGTRFHSMIFSFGMGVPGIAIAYTGNKSQGIMKDMGLSKYVISIYKVSKDDLIKKFNLMVKNKNEIKNKIHEYNIKAEKDTNLLIKKLNEEEISK